jgi:hypothetical protein
MRRTPMWISCAKAYAETALRAWGIRAGAALWMSALAQNPCFISTSGSVAKSTHAGLPWLRYLRQQLGTRVHFWPFDGWTIPAGRSVIAEAYPSLWNREVPPETRTRDQHDAYCIAVSLARADRDGRLGDYFEPELTAPERARAEIEGWILGLPASGRAAN